MSSVNDKLFVRGNGPWHIARRAERNGVTTECRRPMSGPLTRFRSSKAPTGALCPVCSRSLA